MMQYSISELLDMGYTPEEYELEDPTITTASRIEEMTLSAIHAKARKRPRHIGRTLLIAAVITLLLAVGAVAVYRYGLNDAVIEDVGLLPSQTDESEIYLSQNGFSDSPECMAYMEWNSWNNAWTSEHENRYAELGVDDSWYETPENYAHLYGATFAEQAEKLDEILEKYDLTAHTQRWFFRTGSELYGALGTEPFIADAYTIGGEYYYDDGSFKVYGYADEDDWDCSFNLVTTVKGSFTQITLGLNEDAAEQEYTTDDGTALILFTEKSSDRAGFIFSAEGCYVTAVIYTSDEQQVKALADAIDFTAIAALFETPQAREATAESVAAYDEIRANRTYIDTGDDELEQAISFLGDWWLTRLPDGYELDQMDGHTPDFIEDMYRVTRSYGDGVLSLSYYDLLPLDQADEAERLSLDTYAASYSQYELTECEVNGYRAYLVRPSQDILYLMWVDTERELRFKLFADNMTQQELLSIAESMEGTAAESLPRRNSLSEDERFDQAVALYQADYEPLPVSENTYAGFYYSLGCYVPTLPAGYSHTGDTAYKRIEYFEEYSGQVITRYFRTDTDDYIRLSYKRFSAENVSAPDATRAEFDAEREYREQFYPTSDCSVNEYMGYFSSVSDSDCEGRKYPRRCLDWLDTDRGVWFILTSSEDIEDEALLAMAESVAEAEMPERFVFDIGEFEGPPAGDALSEGLTYDLALEELGDLYIPSLQDRLLAETRRGRYDMFYWYMGAEPCAYDGITTLYRDGVALEYTRYWTDESCAAGRGGRSYADMKRFYGAAYEGGGFCDGLTVNGSDAFALMHDGWNELIWYDAERDLIFTLSDSSTTDDNAYSVQELIALAESIQEQ